MSGRDGFIAPQLKEENRFDMSRTDDDENDNMLEMQIREARYRAEEFTKSLLESRERENMAMKLLEAERAQWARAYEEKNVIIEQLERELTSTVATLSSVADSYPMTQAQQRNSDSAIFGGKLNHIPKTNETVANNDQSFLNHQAEQIKSLTEQLKQRELYHEAQMNEYMRHINSLQEQQIEQENFYVSEMKEMELDLKGVRAEMQGLNEEVELLRSYRRDAEGKLQFRLDQVLSFETEKGNWLKTERELKLEHKLLENQLDESRAKYRQASHDLQRAKDHISYLERRVKDLEGLSASYSDIKGLLTKGISENVRGARESADSVLLGDLEEIREEPNRTSNNSVNLKNLIDESKRFGSGELSSSRDIGSSDARVLQGYSSSYQHQRVESNFGSSSSSKMRDFIGSKAKEEESCYISNDESSDDNDDDETVEVNDVVEAHRNRIESASPVAHPCDNGNSGITLEAPMHTLSPSVTAGNKSLRSSSSFDEENMRPLVEGYPHRHKDAQLDHRTLSKGNGQDSVLTMTDDGDGNRNGSANVNVKRSDAAVIVNSGSFSSQKSSSSVAAKKQDFLDETAKPVLRRASSAPASRGKDAQLPFSSSSSFSVDNEQSIGAPTRAAARSKSILVTSTAGSITSSQKVQRRASQASIKAAASNPSKQPALPQDIKDTPRESNLEKAKKRLSMSSSVKALKSQDRHRRTQSIHMGEKPSSRRLSAASGANASLSIINNKSQPAVATASLERELNVNVILPTPRKDSLIRAKKAKNRSSIVSNDNEDIEAVPDEVGTSSALLERKADSPDVIEAEPAANSPQNEVKTAEHVNINIDDEMREINNLAKTRAQSSQSRSRSRSRSRSHSRSRSMSPAVSDAKLASLQSSASRRASLKGGGRRERALSSDHSLTLDSVSSGQPPSKSGGGGGIRSGGIAFQHPLERTQPKAVNSAHAKSSVGSAAVPNSGVDKAKTLRRMSSPAVSAAPSKRTSLVRRTSVKGDVSSITRRAPVVLPTV